MPRTLTEDERAALEAGQNQSRRVRHWRRYRAVLLRADGVPVTEVARALGCSEASVYNWTAAWRRDGAAGVAEGKHPGQAHRLDAAAEVTLEALLVEGDPQAHGYAATGWTVPRHAHRAGQARMVCCGAHHPAHAAPPRRALEASQVRLGPS